MIVCHFCGSKKWSLIHRSIIDPAEDKYKCELCNLYFYRYGKRKEKSKEKR